MVGDDQDRVAVVGELAKEAHDLPLRPGIETRGRLVEDQQ